MRRVLLIAVLALAAAVPAAVARTPVAEGWDGFRATPRA